MPISLVGGYVDGAAQNFPAASGTPRNEQPGTEQSTPGPQRPDSGQQAQEQQNLPGITGATESGKGFGINLSA